jgi:hypothetical protein
MFGVTEKSISKAEKGIYIENKSFPGRLPKLFIMHTIWSSVRVTRRYDKSNYCHRWQLAIVIDRKLVKRIDIEKPVCKAHLLAAHVHCLV